MGAGPALSAVDRASRLLGMSSIGPALPAHLLPSNDASDDDEPGPSLPVAGPSMPIPAPLEEDADEESDDDYGPALPPELAAARAPAPKRVVGPSLPSQAPDPRYDRGAGYGGGDGDDDSDDDFGPQPLPPGVSFDEADGVREFMEREERRRKQIEVGVSAA